MKTPRCMRCFSFIKISPSDQVKNHPLERRKSKLA